MDFKDFTKQALATESVPASLNVNPTFLALVYTLGIEVTNLADMVKKQLAYGKTLDEDKARHHLGNIAGIAALIESEVIQYANETDPSLTFSIKKHNANGESMGPYVAADFPVRQNHAFLGSFTEAGELLKAQMDAIMRNEPVDKVNIAEEYGDADWYKAVAFDEFGIDEQDSRNAILRKLALRYQGGKFDQKAALNRDLTAERSALEGKDTQ